jgi:protein-L-isoaspartate(D-aspartate) O-methyltransferase
VLEIGTGSGYQAAVLAQLAGEVHTIERLPDLAGRARVALELAGCANVRVHVGDGSLGLPEHAPFGAVAVAAAAPEVPASLYAQLDPGGRLVVRSPEGPAVLRSVPCRFVPLVGAEGFDGE